MSFHNFSVNLTSFFLSLVCYVFYIFNVLLSINLKTRLVGLVDNRPSHDKLCLFVKKKNSDIWHVTCDMWNVTHDMWLITRDSWGEVNLLSKVQLIFSLHLTVWEWKCFVYIFTKNESVSQSVNHKGVCRAALATLGLLKTSYKVVKKNTKLKIKSKSAYTSISMFINNIRKY